ncbi:MAG TPA: MmgE/PrpD family protein [Burkholderiales bacterium]|nr:MmgE/PrpD family protein [Burkholderiales bacterium]
MSDLEPLLDWLWTAGPPAEVEDKAREMLLDTLGCVLASSRRARLRSFADRLSAGAVRVPGFAKALAPADAAALFAAAACWDEACEGLARAHGRPGVPVIAACAALAQARSATLGELLDGLVVGYESGGRFGEAIRMQPGMHVDATWPGLGVAVAAVRLGGGSATQAAAAVRIAACQMPRSLFLAAAAGAEARNTYLAHAAQLGLLAAQAALAGFSAPQGALEAIGAGPLAAPGTWVILESYLKPFAAVRHVHYAAASGLALFPRVRGRIGEIARLELATYAEALTYCGNRAPRNAIQAQFSLSYGLANALARGSLDPDAYEDAALAEAQVRELERKVELVEDRALTEAGRRGARLRIVLGGETLEASVSQVEGDPSFPMRRDAVVHKFARYSGRAERDAREFLAASDTTPLAEALRRLAG